MNTSFSHESSRQRVHVGIGTARDHLRAEVAGFHAERILLIATHSASAAATELSGGLPIAARIDGATQHVPLEDAIGARETAAGADADLIVCIGGGSAVGLAKAVVVVSGVPVIAIPTTYAGSEATNIWSVTSDGVKDVRPDDRVLPAVVIYDADLVASLPVQLSVLSALNAVAHCVDTMWATGVSPISQLFAVEGATALARGIRGLAANTTGEATVVPAAASARQACQYGGYLASVAYASVGKALHHEIVHVLGGAVRLPHARAHALILPYVVALNAPRAPEVAKRLADALGVAGTGTVSDPVIALIDGLLDLRDGIEGPWTLAELELDRADIDTIARRICDVVPEGNPRPVSLELVKRLLEAAHAGRDPRELIDAE